MKEVPYPLILNAANIVYPDVPQMSSEMNLFIRSQSNDKRRFITDVGIFALVFPFPLLLPLGAIAVS